MALPKFFYDNRFDDATPVASSTAAGDFNVLNLRDWRPFTFWKPSAMPATVTGDAATLAYEFTNSADGWTTFQATITVNPTTITLTSTGADPQLISPTALSIDGGKNRYIVVRLKRTAIRSWQGTAHYTTFSHGNSGSFQKIIADPTGGVIGGFVLGIWDMHALTAGGDDWKNNTITRFRLDFGQSSTDAFEIDWIALVPSSQRVRQNPAGARSSRFRRSTACRSRSRRTSTPVGILRRSAQAPTRMPPRSPRMRRPPRACARRDA